MRDTSDSRTLPLLPKPRHPNCDVNGRRIRKGDLVEWPIMADQARAEGLPVLQVRVTRVRNGDFWHSASMGASFTPCHCMRVVNA